MVNKLIQIFSMLPGLGPKSAKRIVLHLIENNGITAHLNELLLYIQNNIVRCSMCNNLSEDDLCNICLDRKRETNKICVVDSIDDLWNIESANYYNGLYYIPQRKKISNDTIQEINIDMLLSRIENNNISEIILANSPTVKGQTNAFYITDAIKELLDKKQITQTIITVLGRGIPIGSEIDYLDENTLKAAFQTRKPTV
ncbi:MAG: recombination protein RecR [Alphaproteobacteria bacterium]|nr:recombination protein RecR [Rickettsiales bacterium]